VIINEIKVKGILSKSKVYDYVVNPYRGCQHACTYCYARFMKRFTGHPEPWGEFVDVKINAVELLRVEVKKKKPGNVWVSGVCDPYQPVEAEYRLTRQCLEILVEAGWSVTVQTRSPLVTRDIDVLQTVTTADDRIRQLFEPHAPPIPARLNALDELRRAGIKTRVMIAPLLPGAEGLPSLLIGRADSILIDRMNYDYSNWVYQKYGLRDKLTEEFFTRTSAELSAACRKQGLECETLF
jgi:DNA repair photolyase